MFEFGWMEILVLGDNLALELLACAVVYAAVRRACIMDCVLPLIRFRRVIVVRASLAQAYLVVEWLPSKR